MARRKVDVNNRVVRCTWSIRPDSLVKLQQIIESLKPGESGADSATVDHMINAVYNVLVRRNVVNPEDPALLERVKAKLEANAQYAKGRDHIDPVVRFTDWQIAREVSFFRGALTDEDLAEVTPAAPCPN